MNFVGNARPFQKIAWLLVKSLPNTINSVLLTALVCAEFGLSSVIVCAQDIFDEQRTKSANAARDIRE
jgi:hypothetical protein